MRALDLTNQKFGKLTILEESHMEERARRLLCPSVKILSMK